MSTNKLNPVEVQLVSSKIFNIDTRGLPGRKTLELSTDSVSARPWSDDLVWSHVLIPSGDSERKKPRLIPNWKSSQFAGRKVSWTPSSPAIPRERGNETNHQTFPSNGFRGFQCRELSRDELKQIHGGKWRESQGKAWRKLYMPQERPQCYSNWVRLLADMSHAMDIPGVSCQITLGNWSSGAWTGMGDVVQIWSLPLHLRRVSFYITRSSWWSRLP